MFKGHDCTVLPLLNRWWPALHTLTTGTGCECQSHMERTWSGCCVSLSIASTSSWWDASRHCSSSGIYLSPNGNHKPIHEHWYKQSRLSRDRIWNQHQVSGLFPPCFPESTRVFLHHQPDSNADSSPTTTPPSWNLWAWASAFCQDFSGFLSIINC